MTSSIFGNGLAKRFGINFDPNVDAYNQTAAQFNNYANEIGSGAASGVVSGVDGYADGGGNPYSFSGFQLPEGLASNLSGYASTGSKLLEGIGALMNAQNAKKSLKLANEKFGFEKAAANRNVINQSKSYNEELGRRADVGLALAGNSLNDAQRQATLDKVAGQRLSETAIG